MILCVYIANLHPLSHVGFYMLAYSYLCEYLLKNRIRHPTDYSRVVSCRDIISIDHMDVSYVDHRLDRKTCDGSCRYHHTDIFRYILILCHTARREDEYNIEESVSIRKHHDKFVFLLACVKSEVLYMDDITSMHRSPTG